MTTCASPWPGRWKPEPRARRLATANGRLPACGWSRRWPISGTGMATSSKGGGGWSGPSTWPPGTAERRWPSWRTGSGYCCSSRASRKPRCGSSSAAWPSGVTSATGTSRPENSTASASPISTSTTSTPRDPCWRKAPPSPARSAVTPGSPRPSRTSANWRPMRATSTAPRRCCRRRSPLTRSRGTCWAWPWTSNRWPGSTSGRAGAGRPATSCPPWPATSSAAVTPSSWPPPWKCAPPTPRSSARPCTRPASPAPRKPSGTRPASR